MDPDRAKEVSGMQLSPSSEDYLEAIHQLLKEEPHVHSVQVAQRLKVSKPSVNKAMGVLKEAGLVEQEPYGTLWLTEEGERIARQVAFRHSTLKHFLTDVLGIDEATAETDACRMEHVISNTTLVKWVEYMARQENGGL